MRSNVDNN